MKHIVSFSFVLALLASASLARSEVYYQVPVAELQITEGSVKDGYRWALPHNVRIVLEDGQGEALWKNDVEGDLTQGGSRAGAGSVVIRRDKPGEVRGRIAIPTLDGDFATAKFVVSADKASPEAKKSFLQARMERYQNLAASNYPGAAWFRHQARLARDELLALDSKLVENEQTNRIFNTRDFGDTLDLFSGGRAVSENLQLDREMLLPQTGEDAAKKDPEKLVKLDTIPGIDIPAIDWKPLIEGKSPELDPLAKYIPADQHAIFYPNFDAALRVIEQLDRQGSLIGQSVEPRSEDARVLERYERQLGLKIDNLAKQMGPALLRGIAVTGSDPYFPTGTDVAILFEATDLQVITGALTIQMGLNSTAQAEPVNGSILGVEYLGWQSPDRTMSSYLTVFEDGVVVTNSLAQLERIIATKQGKTPSVSSLDEYRFFRDRYPRSTPGETAFLFLSDATIRRWCSPRWRIGSSRRTRDLAVLSELQASLVPELIEGDVKPRELTTTLSLTVPGKLTAEKYGIRSSTLGTIEFMMPIVELEFDEVTEAEQQAYSRWRDGYQSNWPFGFDPIGLQLVIDEQKIGADLTVMPLIAGSEYNQFIELSKGIKLQPSSGDPHDALAQFVLAINKDSLPLKQASGLAAAFAPQLKVDVLSWLGESVSLYVDDSPIWQEFSKLEDGRERDQFLERRFAELPVAVTVEVSSAIKATAFLAALRAFIDQVGPGMVQWETIEAEDRTYVKVTATERAIRRGDDRPQPALYYALTAESLTISPNEELIKQAIDRQKAREVVAADNAEKKEPTAASTWLGESLCLNLQDRGLQALWALSSREYQKEMQRLSWRNLPILNEWRKLKPDMQDHLVALHQGMWGVFLECPGGGEYVWNDKWQTVESSVFGHPAEPKLGEPTIPTQLQDFSGLRFGLTFEENALRARGELTRRQVEGKK